MRSKGEQAFFEAYSPKKIFESKESEIVQDSFYKFHMNYCQLQEMLYVARRIHFFKKDYQSNSFTFLVMMNLLTSITLAFRRITDDIRHKDNRSFYNLVKKFDLSTRKAERLNRLRQINKKYETMNDKFCAHQDSISVSEALSSFPNSKSIKNDMEYLLAIYREVGLEFFISFPDIDTSKPKYYSSLHKILEIR